MGERVLAVVLIRAVVRRRHRGAALATRNDASGRCIQLLAGLAAHPSAGRMSVTPLKRTLTPLKRTLSPLPYYSCPFFLFFCGLKAGVALYMREGGVAVAAGW